MEDLHVEGSGANDDVLTCCRCRREDALWALSRLRLVPKGRKRGIRRRRRKKRLSCTYFEESRNRTLSFQKKEIGEEERMVNILIL